MRKITAAAARPARRGSLLVVRVDLYSIHYTVSLSMHCAHIARTIPG